MLIDGALHDRVMILARQLKTTPESVLDQAISAMEEKTGGTTEVPKTPQEILQAASDLFQNSGPFSIQELLDTLFADEVLFGFHKTKIQLGNVLVAGGYARRQVWRNKTHRPRLWVKEEEVHAPTEEFWHG